MEKINKYEQALEFLKNGEVLVSTSFGGPYTFYYLKEKNIIIRNDNLKAIISLEEFKDVFLQGDFYLYEVEDEIEIDQNDPYWRQ